MDYKNRIENSSEEDSIFPIISIRKDEDSDEESDIPMIFLKCVYDLLDLYNGKECIRFKNGHIVIGESYHHLSNELDVHDAPGNKTAHIILEKIENVSKFITFVKLSKLYNQEYYNFVMDCINNIEFVVTNNPIYENNKIDSNFVGIYEYIRPERNTNFRIIDIIEKTLVLLDMSFEDKIYGLIGLDWFSTHISKFIMLLQSILPN